MKASTPFWPLLKNELKLGQIIGLGQTAVILLPYWIIGGFLPLLALFGDQIAHGNIATLFATGFLPIIVAMLLTSLTTWIPYATIPALGNLFSPQIPLPGAVETPNGLEFLFTRAVDRRILFRARSTALFICALTPLFLNVIASPFVHEIRFAPRDDTSAESVIRHKPFVAPEEATRYEQYRRAFPSQHQGAIAHGAVAYTAWLAWSAILAFLLVQSYCTLVARRVKSSNWWTGLYAAVPFLTLPLWVTLTARESARMRFNVFENSFLFFSSHPLMMLAALAALAVASQKWCEKRFSQLELP